MGKPGSQGLQGIPGKAGPRGLPGPKGETGHPGDVVYSHPTYEQSPVSYSPYTNDHQVHLGNIYPEYREGTGSFYPKKNKLKRESTSSKHQTKWNSKKRTKQKTKSNPNIKRMDDKIASVAKDSISKKADFFSDLFDSTNSATSLLERDPEMTLSEKGKFNILRDVDLQKVKNYPKKKIDGGKKYYVKHDPIKTKTHYAKSPPSQLATSILYPTTSKVITLRRNSNNGILEDVLTHDDNSYGFQRQTFGNAAKPTVQVSYAKEEYNRFDDSVALENRYDNTDDIRYNQKDDTQSNFSKIIVRGDNEILGHTGFGSKEVIKTTPLPINISSVRYTTSTNESTLKDQLQNQTNVETTRDTKLWSDRPTPTSWAYSPNKIAVVPTPNLANRKKYRKPPKRKLIRKAIRQRVKKGGNSNNSTNLVVVATSSTTTERNNKYITSDSLKEVAESFAPLRIQKYTIFDPKSYSGPTEKYNAFKADDEENLFPVTDHFESKREPKFTSYTEKTGIENYTVSPQNWLNNYPQITTYVPPQYPHQLHSTYYRKI